MARYGRRHHEMRLRLLPAAIGTPCSRCGKPMLADEALDLDHNDEGTGYLGFSHASCNRREGGFNSNGAARYKHAPAVVPTNPQPEAATRW